MSSSNTTENISICSPAGARRAAAWLILVLCPIVLKDINGNVANISTYDVYPSNGVIHVIDRVEMPSFYLPSNVQQRSDS